MRLPSALQVLALDADGGAAGVAGVAAVAAGARTLPTGGRVVTTAQSLVAILRSHIDRDHDRAERLIAELDPYAARMALRELSVFAADCIRIMCGNEAAEINETLEGLGLTAAQHAEVTG